MPVPSHREPVARHLLRETAYAALRDAIVGGTLAPGERLHDDELCDWLGLSRTPVRDALIRLRDEGLVDISPQRSTRVTCCGRRDARDLFPLLAAVHALAAQLAVPRLTRLDLARLQAENDAFVSALRRRSGPDAYAADDRFHGVLVAAADNAEIARCLDRLAPALHRLERLKVGPLPGRRAVAQHQAIVARAQARDAAGAASAVRENWLTLGTMIEHSIGD